MAVVQSVIRGTAFENATEAEIAYVAGLFEGEGCVSLLTAGQPRMTVRIVIRELEVLQKVTEITGVGGIYHRAPPKMHPNWSVTYEWAINLQETVDEFLEAIWPWLSERRRQQISDVEDRKDEYGR